jgi:hypothetical protein
MKAILNVLGDAEAHCCSHLAGNRGAILGSRVLRELLGVGSHSACDFGLALKEGRNNQCMIT